MAMDTSRLGGEGGMIRDATYLVEEIYQPSVHLQENLLAHVSQKRRQVDSVCSECNLMARVA